MKLTDPNSPAPTPAPVNDGEFYGCDTDDTAESCVDEMCDDRHMYSDDVDDCHPSFDY